jgi:hypothetical protein
MELIQHVQNILNVEYKRNPYQNYMEILQKHFYKKYTWTLKGLMNRNIKKMHEEYSWLSIQL